MQKSWPTILISLSFQKKKSLKIKFKKIHKNKIPSYMKGEKELKSLHNPRQLRCQVALKK